ncbi:MAG: hypothetical protein AMXMBFR33_08290 [Candidatus Xenobia bacterium]
MKRSLIVLTFLFLPVLAQTRFRVNAPTVAWPPGPGQEVVTRCVACHGPELIQAQRLSQAQWDKVLTKMQSWGAVLSQHEKTRLVEYLGRHYGSEVPDAASVRVRLERLP